MHQRAANKLHTYLIPLKLSLIFLFNSLLTWSLPIGEWDVNDKWLISNSLWKSTQWLSFEPIDRTSLSLAAAGKTIASWHSLAAETQTHTHTSTCTHTHVVMNNPWWSRGQEPCVWKINSTQGLMTAGKKENRKAEARERHTHTTFWLHECARGCRFTAVWKCACARELS